MPLTAKDRLDKLTDLDGAATTAPQQSAPTATQVRREPHDFAPTPKVEEKVQAVPTKRQVWIFETTNPATGYEMIVSPAKTGVTGIPDPNTGRPLGSQPHKKVKFRQGVAPGPDGKQIPICFYSTDDETEANAIMTNRDFRAGLLRMRDERAYQQLAEIEKMHAEALAKLGRRKPFGPAFRQPPSEFPQVVPQLRSAPTNPAR